jgi:phage recombination protein Bet
MPATVPARSNSLVMRMADRYGIDSDKMMVTLKATAFKGDVSTEQMMALLVVAEQYGLNPWTREIYAFPDRGGIVPVVGVDGWSRIINTNPQFDGMDFEDGPLDAKKIPEWMECRIHRKDRAHPVCVREYFAEVYRDTSPWKSHPRRMLRHKAMIQAARLAFGFVGIFDEDEGERIAEATIRRTDMGPRPDLSDVDTTLRDKRCQEITDLLVQDKHENAIADELRGYVAENLQPFHELWIAVNDKLAKDGVISKANFKKYLSLNLQGVRDLHA